MTEPGVWQQLDYTTGELSRRTHRLLAVVLVISTVVALGLVVLFRSGAITPRVGWPRESVGISWTEAPGYLSIVFDVENHGMVPLTIVGIGEDLPGMELQPGLTGWLPLSVAAGDVVEVRLAYRITDCGAFQRLSTIPVRIQRYWGTQTGRIDFDPDRLHNLHCKTPLDQG